MLHIETSSLNIPGSFAHFLNVCACTLFWGEILSFYYVVKEAVSQKRGHETLVCVTVCADSRGKVHRPDLPVPAASPVSDWLRLGELKCVKWGGNHFLVGANRWNLSALCRSGVVYTRN